MPAHALMRKYHVVSNHFQTYHQSANANLHQITEYALLESAFPPLPVLLLIFSTRRNADPPGFFEDTNLTISSHYEVAYQERSLFKS